jgi:hypothetical protein
MMAVAISDSTNHLVAVSVAPSDSVAGSATDSLSALRLRPDEYRMAGSPRYTITGELPFRETHVQPVASVITGVAVAGLITGVHLYQEDAWWKDNRQPFHFGVDWGYAAQADKFGHMFGGHVASYLAYESLIASGIGRNTARWLGPTLGLAFATYVEVEDGFAGWGFDPTDEYADILGALLFAGQQYVPALENVRMKFSYWPTTHLNQGVPGHKTIVVDDYNGQTAWISFNVHNILPTSIRDYWPRWLRLAAGYGASNVDIIDSNGVMLTPQRHIYISLDYDLVDVVPNLGSFGNWLVQTLDYFHFPAPALQIYPDVRFELLFPIHL